MNKETVFDCTADFRDYLLKDLAEPEFAKLYLETALENYEEDGDTKIAGTRHRKRRRSTNCFR